MRPQPRHRRHRDDAAPRRSERRPERLRQQEGRTGVDREGPVPVLRPAARRAGAAPTRRRSRRRRRGRRAPPASAPRASAQARGIGEVAGQVGRAHAAAAASRSSSACGAGLRPLAVSTSSSGSPRAAQSCGEPQRGRAADAVARAGDDDLHCSPPSCPSLPGREEARAAARRPDLLRRGLQAAGELGHPRRVEPHARGGDRQAADHLAGAGAPHRHRHRRHARRDSCRSPPRSRGSRASASRASRSLAVAGALRAGARLRRREPLPRDRHQRVLVAHRREPGEAAGRRREVHHHPLLAARIVAQPAGRALRHADPDEAVAVDDAEPHQLGRLAPPAGRGSAARRR